MPFRFTRTFLCLAALNVLTLGGVTGASAQTRLLRFPDVHQDKVVFTYAGDLWLAPAAGGAATRLTAHPGIEVFAKFSPDGQSIAFTGQYEGDEQVYVIPATGGVPSQLTWYPARGPLSPRWGYDNQVHGWTSDGKQVLFRSLRDGWDLSDSRLYTVPLTGSLGEPLAMPVSDAGDLSPDGQRVVYTPMARDFRTWKRYQGGWAQDLWIFDLATHEAKNITSHPRTDRDPMWIGDTIYFNSDRTGTLNLYSYDPQSGATAQLTRSTRGDVRWPSGDAEGRIVYEMEGELALFDVRTGQSRPIPITVPSEGLGYRPAQVSAAGQIEDGALSPKGERALFVARGDVFTVPVAKGVTRHLTRTSNAHDKWARWSPDGRKVAFISDRDGEEELYLVNQDGSGKPEQLTDGGKALRYEPAWAPDGKRIAFSDKDGKLYVLTLDGRKLTEIADDRRSQINDYTWSPCGGWLAFSLRDDNGFRSIHLWSAEDGKLRRVNDESFDESSPAWDPQGNYLYYLSGRDYSPMADFFDFNYALGRNIGVYALALRRDVPHPFPPESDEVAIEEEKGGEKKDEKKDDGKAAQARPLTRIDFDGLAGRVARVPVPFGNYGSLGAKDGHLLYLRNGSFFFNGESDPPSVLQIFALKERKETTLAENVQGYSLSQDGGKVLVQQGPEIHILDASPAGKDSRKPVSTAGLVVDRVPAEEWAQIFDESWRRYRDFFYVETMHGYDWEALRRQYRPLLAHVGHRSDLNYVIGEMIAELNVSHAYVAGGDFQLPARPRVALPGARFALDDRAGRYKIARIFRGQNEEDLYRSPLTEIGMDVREGDYLLAIDGEDLPAHDNPYRLLRHKADRPVRFTVNDRPAYEGAREVVFTPLSSETSLVYLDWITANRERVEKLSGGRVGYIHIPDMGGDGLREFVKAFYPQLRKEGLIVDVRSNGGGFVSQTILERLRRELLSVDFSRTDDSVSTYPQAAFHGHMASLINETSSSDGDVFAAMFRQSGLGPLIGKRTWGGVVGITSRGPLLDGGEISVPEAASASVDGQWIIEGEGVAPDIDVENDPKSILAGRDPQLERGVDEVMKKIREQPRKLPARPAPPVKTQAGQ